MKFKLRIRNLAQIVQVCRNGELLKVGQDQMNDIAILNDASIVVALDGTIYAVDTEANLLMEEWYGTAEYELDLDGAGKSLVPGFVDAHTHPVWDGDRVGEYEMKLAGATYMDIHKSGGGIGFTVKHTKAASFETLQKLLLKRLNRMLRFGTTCVEAKSGYGLETETEMKMLKVLHETSKVTPLDISATFLGAHSIPAGKTSAEATKDVLNRQLPELMRLKLAGEISPENIDVFLEKGVFNREETKEILMAGKKAGLCINFHGDELSLTHSGELGAELDARAISHLEEVSEEGMKAMATKQVFAVLLPTTAYVLRIQPPPARKLIEHGVPIVLGSDFNPNAHCLSMPHVMNLACTMMKLTLNEALVASTINAAGSLNRADKMGSLEKSKLANFVMLECKDWRHLIYEMVDPPILGTWIKGVECKWD